MNLEPFTLAIIALALLAAFGSLLVAFAKYLTRAVVSDGEGTELWINYEVAIDKNGRKYFVSELPDGVQPLPPLHELGLYPEKLPNAEAWLEEPGKGRVPLELPAKFDPTTLDEGTVITVKVIA